MAVSGVEQVAKLAVMPANPRQAALQRSDACRAPRRVRAVGAGGEIEPDRLGSGGTAADPAGEARRKNVANRSRRRAGCCGPGGAGIVFGGLGERGEAIVLCGAGRWQNTFVDTVLFTFSFSDNGEAWKGSFGGVFVLLLALHY